MFVKRYPKLNYDPPPHTIHLYLNPGIHYTTIKAYNL